MKKLNAKTGKTLGHALSMLWCTVWFVIFLIGGIVMVVNDDRNNLVEKIAVVGIMAFLAMVFVAGTVHGVVEFVRQGGHHE